MKTSLKPLIIAAEFSAIIAILSQFTIPLGYCSIDWANFRDWTNSYFIGAT